jgi:hypothetical protein
MRLSHATFAEAQFRGRGRRYDLKPFRYRNQRRTTIMVKTSASFAGSRPGRLCGRIDGTCR